MELFSFLDPLREAGFAVDFVPRVEGVAGSYDKEEGLAALEPFHRQAVEKLGYRWDQLWRAEQVHGSKVVTANTLPGKVAPSADGLVTNQSDILLGIFVADCGLIWLADRETGAIGLLHSGRKGTEGGILTQGIAQMSSSYGTRPQDLLVALGPCIRPPHYEVDIASQIASQAQKAGVGDFLDCGICTGAEVASYYSYRIEKGLTGRMLGLLGSNLGPCS